MYSPKKTIFSIWQCGSTAQKRRYFQFGNVAKQRPAPAGAELPCSMPGSSAGAEPPCSPPAGPSSATSDEASCKRGGGSNPFMRRCVLGHLLIHELDLRENPINPISLPQNLLKTPRKPDKPDKPDGLDPPKGRGSTSCMKRCVLGHFPIHEQMRFRALPHTWARSSAP